MRPAFWRRKQRSTRNQLCGITFEFQLRLSIFQSIEHPKGCSVAPYGGMGPNFRLASLREPRFQPRKQARSRIKVAKGGAAFQSDPSDGKVSCHVSDMSKHRGKFRPPPSSL